MLTSTYSATWGLFNDALDVGDLAGAEALLTGSGRFAKTMKRLCLHSATGVHVHHGLVSKGPHFTTMCTYLHSCVQSDSNSHKHLQVC